jgi:alanine-synthesizing transaminase
MVDLAAKHGLIVFSDEIYEKILYDGTEFTNTATITGDDVLCMTFSGLSKAYRICGYRSGWLAISGPKADAADYLEGINLLANMRMCANVPGQHAIQTALGGHQSIEDLILPGGRLREQRDIAYRLLNEIPGVSVNQAKGALYLFPKLDPEAFPIKSDEKFALDLLRQQKILISHGTAFNWVRPDHFRLVTLPNVKDLEEAIGRIAEFLSTYKP